MWKESYRLGVETIDMQHMELFKMVGELLNAVQSGKGDSRKECMSAISYLKDYTLQHFHDEEEYQKFIRHPGFAEHKIMHQNFVRDVLNHERKMLISDFHTRDVKDFMGTLIAWLVYHVAGADQQIISGDPAERTDLTNTPLKRFFYISVCDILNKITELDVSKMKTVKEFDNDLQPAISVTADLNGEVSGSISFIYTQRLAFDLIKAMTTYTPKEIDEMVCSAMLEISNIVSVRAIGMMSSRGFSCSINNRLVDVNPVFIPANESVIVDTGLGILEMEALINMK